MRSSIDLDERARTAARDARASVASVAQAALAGDLAMPPRRGTVVALGRLAVLAVLAVMAGIALVVPDGDDDSAVVADGTREDPPSAPPQSPFGDDFGDSAVAEGNAADGRAWVLNVGGPSAGLCFTTDVPRATACQGHRPSEAIPAGERYRPVVFDDLRGPPFVFGRMPADVAAVEVILEGGEVGARQPVLPSDDGPVYAVELDAGTTPAAVLGIRADGSSMRFDVPS